jgi:hypothetical protein
MRQSAKPVNFGLPGLMGAPKLVYTARKDGIKFCELAKVSEDCAKNVRVYEYKGRTISPTCCECLALAEKYKALWLEEWPEMSDYFDVMQQVADDCANGIPLESFGTGMKRLETSAGSICNHYFQNLAAQGAKHAAWLLSKECYTDRSSVLFNSCRPVVFVHDEIISEVREQVAHECAVRQSAVMVAAMKEYVPDVKITAEPALMRRWYKGAEAVYANGRLVPWEPKS